MQDDANARVVGVQGDRPAQAREVKLPEFSKLAPQFDGKSSDPVDAENWIMRVEKSFSAFKVPERMKIPHRRVSIGRSSRRLVEEREG